MKKSSQTVPAVESDLFRSLIENSSDGIVLINPRGKILYASPAVKKILGYDLKEFVGMLGFKFVYPRDLPIVMTGMTKLLAKSGNMVTVTCRVKRKNKSLAWLEVTGTNLLNDLVIGAIVVNFRDLTERKEAERQLYQTNQTLQAVIQASPLAVYVIDRNGKVLMWSKKAEAIFGWQESEVLGKILPIVQSSMRWEFLSLMKQLKNGQSFTRETVRQRKDGSIFDVSISAAPIFDGDGKINRIVAITSDITERKELERQKDDFMGVVSHELRTPVTSLKAFGQVLYQQLKRQGDNSSAAMIGKMDNQINKLTTLIKDLLDVAKIESGQWNFNQTKFSFDNLVDEVIEEVQRTTSKHRIIRQGQTSKQISGDRERISQVITNFLTNAIKYSPKSTEIIVHTKADDKTLTCSVEDFGVGIPKNKQAHVFDRFYRVDDEAHKTVPGIGLGLYISAQIINKQGGEIWLKSGYRKGSIFGFTLPLTKKS